MKIFKNILLFILFSLVSCQKGGNGYIRGTVYEAGTNVPMPNAYIQLRQSYDNGDQEIIGYTTTDANGKYNINYRHQYEVLVGGYSYYVGAGNYVDDTGQSLVEYKKTARDFSLVPPAYLKLVAVKTSATNHYLKINVPSQISVNNSVLTSSVTSPYTVPVHATYASFQYTNWPNGDSPCFFVKGNTTFTVSWQVFDNIGAISGNTQVPLFINKGDTMTYTITFN